MLGKASKGIAHSIGIISLVTVFLASVIVSLYIWEKRNNKDNFSKVEDETVQYNGAEYSLRENVETFLVMGLDTTEANGSVSDSYNNTMQADFLLLFVFDKDAQKCSVIQINRDTMTEMNVLGVAGQKVGTVNAQIALAHTYGNGKEVSCRNTADAVSTLLGGIRINHYLSVKMDFVPLFNDLVGGVEVTVLDDFTGVDDTLIKGEKITLNGEQALHYVRSRQGLADSTNNTRMARQRQYLSALYEKTLACMSQNESFVVDATMKLADYMVTDRSVTQLQELMRKMSSYEFDEIKNIDGEFKLGEQFVEFYPSESSIKAIVMEIFYKKVEESA